MKTVAEIQHEIRNIREDIIKMDNKLQLLDEELSEFKDVQYEESVYQRVYDIALTMPVIRHPIVEQAQDVKGNYFAILISVGSVEDPINNDQLLFLQRMIESDQNSGRIEYYMGLSRKLPPKDIIYNMNDVVKGQLARQLTLDLLIIIGLSRKKSQETFSVLADIISIIEIDADELKQITDVSVMILKQSVIYDLDYENVITINKDFGYYLSEIAEWAGVLGAAEKDEVEKKKLKTKLANELAGIERNAYERYGENWYFYDD